MSVPPAFAQIPEVKPEAPPFVPDLVGAFDPVWWLLLIAAIVVFGIAFASYRGVIRLRIAEEFPLLFLSPVAAAVAVAALAYGT
ncbi:hypothetical protein RBB84_19285 [Rhodococcus sp. D-6]|uniref:Uncharacterized protein n=2 Tax=Rhodococcus TaxID=1827 RepID=A0A7M2XWL0_9NOCA|nr:MULTISPECIES: hypothetical protein [Rhodococcus]QOW01978.1 hypothetical protein INP59_26765 [Rhodococcus pyridinivorans]WSE25880.1 hypothetical protein U9J23_27070 [Rhodococcus sp. PD04]BDB63336.1 hypothetical protein RDE2_51300 [Rhodococcus sp. RDE2]